MGPSRNFRLQPFLSADNNLVFAVYFRLVQSLVGAFESVHKTITMPYQGNPDPTQRVSYVVIAEILTFAYRLSGKHKDFMDDIEMQVADNAAIPPPDKSE